MLDDAEKVSRLTPAPWKVEITIGGLGQIAPPLALQATDVQLRPALTGSLTVVPSAEAGPLLLTVMA